MKCQITATANKFVTGTVCNATTATGELNSEVTNGVIRKKLLYTVRMFFLNISILNVYDKS